LSQQVAAKALDLLEQFNQMKGRTRGSFKAAFAESRLKEARSDMLNAEGALVDFVKVNRNYLASSDPAIRLYGLRLEAELKLQQQLVITLAMSREQALMEEKNDIPILNVLDEPAIPAIHSSPKRLRLLLVGLFLAILVVETVERSAKIKLLLSSRM
jgi:capsule polysaccharide export protein KpsE/RkpR